MTDSQVTLNKGGGTTFAGPDATALFRAITVRRALLMYADTGLTPNRVWTPTAMLKAATTITNKHYKRGEHRKAATDVQVWVDTMKAGMPVVDERKEQP